MKLLSFIVVILILFTHSIFADCPHCFTVIKVKITYYDEVPEVVYLKFYRSYEISQNDNRPKEHENLIRYFPETLDTIQFIDTIYKIKDLPSFIENKSIRKIALKKIQAIYIIEWTNITGACELPNLTHESVQKLTSCKSFISKLKSFNVHDEIYIYTDTILDAKEFNFLIEKSYNYAEAGPSVITFLNSKGIKINENKNIFPSERDMNLAFEYYFGQIDEKSKSISDVNISNNVNEYFDLLKKYYQKKRDYYSLIQEYLNSGESQSLIDFLNTDNIYTYYNSELTNKISNTQDNEVERIRTVIYLIKKDYIVKVDSKLEELFSRIVDDYNIIILSVSWD